MNLYFLIEGEKTEKKLYHHWLNYFLPSFTKAETISEVNKFNFLMISGCGIPSIYNHVVNAVKDICSNPKFNKLIVCLDGEEIGPTRRRNELLDFLKKENVSLPNNCQLEIVVQDVCIETWFLGISSLIKQNPTNTNLVSYMRHYDVKNRDPEFLPNLNNSSVFNTKAQFHVDYFKAILKEHNDPKLVYSKRNPSVVLEESFIIELQARTINTNHLGNLKRFFELIESIKSEIKYYS